MASNGIIDINSDIYKEYAEYEQLERVPGEGITDYDFPENKWKIVEHKYKHTGEKNYWNITSYDILKYNEESDWFDPYMTFGRNYHSLGNDLIAYTIQNDKEFLITSSDYQYLTILNLTDGEIKSYAYGDASKGNAFCPVSVEFHQINDSENELKIYGCFWACPYETLVIKNIDLNDLSETYNISNDSIERIDDEYDEEISPDEMIDEETREKVDKKEVTNLDMNVAIDLINNDDFDQVPIQFREDFKLIILKALLYYADNVM